MLVITSVAMADDAPPDAPEKLTRLTLNFEAAVERATGPLRAAYVSELEKLKKEYTKAGELQSALAVDATIKSIEALPASSATANQTSNSRRRKYTYQFVPGLFDYAAATKRATDLGGIVAFPRTENDIDTLAKLAAESGAPQILLGATRASAADAEWICSDGTKLETSIFRKIIHLEEPGRTVLRLGDGRAVGLGDPKSLNAHALTPLPFIVAIQKP